MGEIGREYRRGSVARHTLITYPLPGQYREEVMGSAASWPMRPPPMVLSVDLIRRFGGIWPGVARIVLLLTCKLTYIHLVCISHLPPPNSQQRAERLLSSLLDATPVRRPSSSRPSRMVMTTSASPTASLPASPEDLARSPAACPRRRLRSDPER